MLTAKGASFFSSAWVVSQDDRPVTTLRFGWGDACEFVFAGHRYRVKRARMFSSDYSLLCDDVEIGGAVHPRIFSRAQRVYLAGRALDLRPAGFFERGYDVFEAGQWLGGVACAGVFRRRVSIDFGDVLPVETQLLLFALVAVQWRASEASSSA